jgi:hypothetical protein
MDIRMIPAVRDVEPAWADKVRSLTICFSSVSPGRNALVRHSEDRTNYYDAAFARFVSDTGRYFQRPFSGGLHTDHGTPGLPHAWRPHGNTAQDRAGVPGLLFHDLFRSAENAGKRLEEYVKRRKQERAAPLKRVK